MHKTSIDNMNVLLPTRAGKGKIVWQDNSFEPLSENCDGKGFWIFPPKKTRDTLSPLRQDKYHAQCMPTPRTGSNCALAVPSFTERTSKDGGSFLLNSAQMHSDNKIPSPKQRLKLCVSDKFLAAAMGFPFNWISSALAESV